MRGADRQSGKLFSYVSPESLVPQEHPLRAIRLLVNAALERSVTGVCGDLCADSGGPRSRRRNCCGRCCCRRCSTVRSERQLMQQITYNMLFRWFVGLAMDAPVWDVTVFTKNRDRLLEGDIARGFLAAILADPQVKPLLSSEHFSVDGTLDRGLGVDEELPAEGRQRRAARRRGATASATFTARSAATRRTPRPPIRMPGCSRRRPGKHPGCATWGTR